MIQSRSNLDSIFWINIGLRPPSAMRIQSGINLDSIQIESELNHLDLIQIESGLNHSNDSIRIQYFGLILDCDPPSRNQDLIRYQSGFHPASSRIQCGFNRSSIRIWFQPGFNPDSLWIQSGSNLDPIWIQSGLSPESICFQSGFNPGAIRNQRGFDPD